MEEGGYLRRQRIFQNQPGIYMPTPQGLKLAGLEKFQIKPLNVATLAHDLVVIDIAVFYHHQGYKTISEMELRRMVVKKVGERGTRERMPDLVLEKNGKVTAVEFENSPKSASRMTSVLRFYARSRKYDECWFFYSSETWRNRWEKAGASKNSRIKLFSWKGDEKKNAGTARAAGS